MSDEVLALDEARVSKSLHDPRCRRSERSAAEQGRRPGELRARHNEHRAQFSHGRAATVQDDSSDKWGSPPPSLIRPNN